MDERDWLAERFEEHRPHLRAVAYRMLGSLSEADDAVQEAWLRLSRADTGEVENLRRLADHGRRPGVPEHAALARHPARGAARRAACPTRSSRRSRGTDPEQEAVLADSVGLALLVVLDTLTPAERLAFVLHDMFAVPFEEIAPMVERSPAAARQLASRARRRVQGPAPAPDPDLARQRRGRRRVLRRGPRTATSTRWSRCSTPTSCCAPTAAPARARPHGRAARRAGRRRAGVLGRAEAGPVRPPGAGQRRGRRGRHDRRAAVRGHGVHRRRTAGSSRSTSWTTRSGWPGST